MSLLSLLGQADTKLPLTLSICRATTVSARAHLQPDPQLLLLSTVSPTWQIASNLWRDASYPTSTRQACPLNPVHSPPCTYCAPACPKSGKLIDCLLALIEAASRVYLVVGLLA